ncbi:hypothetical protein ACA910_021707 [Epithemia clementina (nom. ined.)]
MTSRDDDAQTTNRENEFTKQQSTVVINNNAHHLAKADDASNNEHDLIRQENSQHHGSDDTTSSSISSSSIRSWFGQASVTVSHTVNNHLIEARILTMTTICLLTVYGISQSPLFFRYRTVAEIPSHWFRQRKFIHGRLINVWVNPAPQPQHQPVQRSFHRGQPYGSSNRAAAASTTTTTNNSIIKRNQPEWSKVLVQWNGKNQNEKILERNMQNFVNVGHDDDDGDDSQTERCLTPIYCMIRHASPVESLLSHAWYERVMQWHPFSTTTASTSQNTRPDQREDQLLIVELAGVRSLSLVRAISSSSSSNNSFPQQTLDHNSNGFSNNKVSLLASMSSDMVAVVGAASNKATSSSNNNNKPLSDLEWLESLAKERLFVSCQLLGRRTPSKQRDEPSNNRIRNLNATLSHKRRLPTGYYMNHNSSAEDVVDRNNSENNVNSSSNSYSYDKKKNDQTTTKNHTWTNLGVPQIAIGRLYYRSPNSFLDRLRQIMLPKDLSLSLVETGRACVIENGETLVSSSSSSSYSVSDTTDSVRHLQHDVAYLERLHKAQHQAIAQKSGMWHNPTIRKVCSDLVKEAEYHTTARWWQKLWRWMLGI